MQYSAIKAVILDKLGKELPDHLAYHNLSHFNDVIDVATQIGEAEKVSADELVLLQTAALFHDTGFLYGAKDHEIRSCELAQAYLPHYDYTQDQIDTIKGMIMATRVPQSPKNKLEEILADADLDYLGRDDFFTTGNRLYQEMTALGLISSEAAWNVFQEKFLEEHRYFTRTAIEKRSKKKQENLAIVKLNLQKAKQPAMSATHSSHKGPMFSVSDVIYLILSVLCASFGLKSFLVPNHFLDGGVTGLSLLLYEVKGWNLGLLLLLLNIPFIILSYFKVGKHFAIRSSLTIILIAFTMHFLPFPELTHDKLLVAMFGGFFLGIGIGLSMRGGGTFDGMEVFALLTLKKSSFSITEIILGMNILIFIIAAAFMKIETALYAILTYLVASQMTKYVIEGIEAYTGVTIVSGQSEAIKRELVLTLNRGITVYKGERGFMKESFEQSADVDIIFTIVTRLEVRKLKNIVHAIDPKAFIFTQTVREPQGGIVKEIVKH